MTAPVLLGLNQRWILILSKIYMVRMGKVRLWFRIYVLKKKGSGFNHIDKPILPSYHFLTIVPPPPNLPITSGSMSLFCPSVVFLYGLTLILGILYNVQCNQYVYDIYIYIYMYKVHVKKILSAHSMVYWLRKLGFNRIQ